MEPTPEYDPEAIDLRRYAAIVWRWKWLIVGCTVLAALAAFVVSRLQVPVYQASTALLVSQSPDSQTSDYNALLMSERLTRTYAQMLTQRPVLIETLTRTGVVMDVEDFAESVEVEPVRDTQLIRVNVEHTYPSLAAELANTLAEVFAEQNQALEAGRFAASKSSLEAQLQVLEAQIEEVEAGIRSAKGRPAEVERLQSTLATYQASYTGLLQSYEELRRQEAGASSNVIQVEPAAVPDEPIRPRTLVNTLLAAVVGAMLALGGAFLLEYLDDSVKTEDEVERLLGLPVLGTIVSLPEAPRGKPYVAAEPRSPAAEAFRSLRTNIQFAGVDHPVQSLLITSPGPEDGKSTVAANLAAIMAQGGKRVVLLDADLRRPKVHTIADLSNDVGLTDLLVRSPLSLNGAVRTGAVDGLRLVTSGKIPPNPAEMLGSERMKQILATVGREADLVIIDSPPAAVVTDPTVLSGQCDGVLLVLEPGKTQRGAARQAVENLRRAGARLIGAVFNNVPVGRAGYYGGLSYDYYYAQDGESPGRRRRGRADA